MVTLAIGSHMVEPFTLVINGYACMVIVGYQRPWLWKDANEKEEFSVCLF